MAIMWECRQFKEEIAQETWECLTGYRKEDQEGTSIKYCIANVLYGTKINSFISYNCHCGL